MRALTSYNPLGLQRQQTTMPLATKPRGRPVATKAVHTPRVSSARTSPRSSPQAEQHHSPHTGGTTTPLQHPIPQRRHSLTRRGSADNATPERIGSDKITASPSLSVLGKLTKSAVNTQLIGNHINHNSHVTNTDSRMSNDKNNLNNLNGAHNKPADHQNGGSENGDEVVTGGGVSASGNLKRGGASTILSGSSGGGNLKRGGASKTSTSSVHSK